MESPRRLAEARTLNPVRWENCQRVLRGFRARSRWLGRTFIGVDDIVLDDDVPPVDGVILLRFPSHLPQVGCRLLPAACSSARWLRRVGDAQHMAGEELFGGDRVGDTGAGGRFGLAGGEQDIGRGD